MSSHFIFCHKGDVLPVMRDGIEESVAGGWRGECLGIESAADRPASIGPHLIAYVIDDFIPGQFAPDAFGIKKRYLAMFATSQLTAAVVLQYEGYFLGCNRENVLGRTDADAQRIVYTSLRHPYGRFRPDKFQDGCIVDFLAEQPTAFCGVIDEVHLYAVSHRIITADAT